MIQTEYGGLICNQTASNSIKQHQTASNSIKQHQTANIGMWHDVTKLDALLWRTSKKLMWPMINHIALRLPTMCKSCNCLTLSMLSPLSRCARKQTFYPGAWKLWKQKQATGWFFCTGGNLPRHLLPNKWLLTSKQCWPPWPSWISPAARQVHCQDRRRIKISLSNSVILIIPSVLLVPPCFDELKGDRLLGKLLIRQATALVWVKSCIGSLDLLAVRIFRDAQFFTGPEVTVFRSFLEQALQPWNELARKVASHGIARNLANEARNRMERLPSTCTMAMPPMVPQVEVAKRRAHSFPSIRLPTYCQMVWRCWAVRPITWPAYPLESFWFPIGPKERGVSSIWDTFWDVHSSDWVELEKVRLRQKADQIFNLQKRFAPNLNNCS